MPPTARKPTTTVDMTALARYTPDASKILTSSAMPRRPARPISMSATPGPLDGMAMRMINWAGDGNGYVGNLDLKPEVAHTLSATADWHDAVQKEWGLKVTPYYTYVDDYIDAERCDSNAGWQCLQGFEPDGNQCVCLSPFRQSGSARFYGLDVSGYYALAKNPGLRQLHRDRHAELCQWQE